MPILFHFSHSYNHNYSSFELRNAINAYITAITANIAELTRLTVLNQISAATRNAIDMIIFTSFLVCIVNLSKL